MNPTNLKGFDLVELQAFVESIGESRFRAQQIFRWLYGSGVSSFEEMTNLSKELRTRLNEVARIGSLKCVALRQSQKDQSTKFLFELEDGRKIESVLMSEDGRHTLCVSTQVGCAIDCKFCATGMMGLQRNLTAGEIIDQLLTVQSLSATTVSNVVFMGMGEPFHNYENVIKACHLMSDEHGPNLSKKHIVVSTSGLVPQILQFADEGQKYRLAISLNATTDAVRSPLMPLNKKWPIKELLRAAKYYTQKSEQIVTFEYVLMAGINDSVEDAERLKKLAQGILCKINLIPYNATEGQFRRPTENRILQFYERMASLRSPVTIRWSKGDDIAAGCGQLAIKNLE
jgi:23S rRNA (adenine2503-C2)-methyltransferase